MTLQPEWLSILTPAQQLKHGVLPPTLAADRLPFRISSELESATRFAYTVSTHYTKYIGVLVL